MKIRNGFVSNSSSSSFVAVGIKVKESDLDIKSIMVNKMGKTIEPDWTEEDIYDAFREDIYETDFQFRNDSEQGVVTKNNEVVLTKTIISGEAYDLDNEETSIDELIKMGQEIKDFFGVDGEIKLYSGIELC